MVLVTRNEIENVNSEDQENSDVWVILKKSWNVSELDESVNIGETGLAGLLALSLVEQVQRLANALV